MFGFFEQCGDNVFFVGLEIRADVPLFNCPCKGLDGKVLHKKDLHEAFSVGEGKEHERKKAEEKFDNRHEAYYLFFPAG